MQESTQILKEEARKNYLKGAFLKAIETQVKVVNSFSEKEGLDYISALKRLGLYLFAFGDYQGAINVFKLLNKKAPDDPESISNFGIVLMKAGQIEKAIKEFEKALRFDPAHPEIYDALAHAYGLTGQIEKCKQAGEKSLTLKDQQAARSNQVYSIPQKPPPAFNWSQPEQNIISFSLWGNNPRYLEGALRNSSLAWDLYPGWRCRFYCDQNVPLKVRETLKINQAEVILMKQPKSFQEGLFWRFLVIEDPKVERFLIRDSDSVINIKERVAVDEWLASERYFHIMRDFYSHTEVILAGMWGGVGGIFPSIKSLQEKFYAKNKKEITKNHDQFFLKEMIYPTVRKSCLIHDRLFRVFGAKEYPRYGQLAPNRHIGQNEAAIR